MAAMELSPPPPPPGAEEVLGEVSRCLDEQDVLLRKSLALHQGARKRGEAVRAELAAVRQEMELMLASKDKELSRVREAFAELSRQHEAEMATSKALREKVEDLETELAALRAKAAADVVAVAESENEADQINQIGGEDAVVAMEYATGEEQEEDVVVLSGVTGQAVAPSTVNETPYHPIQEQGEESLGLGAEDDADAPSTAPETNGTADEQGEDAEQ